MSSTGTTKLPVPQARKRPAPTTEIQESELGSLVAGILSKASAPAAKTAKTATGAKKVTAVVTPVKQAPPNKQAPSTPKTSSLEKPATQAPRKIATPRPIRRENPTRPSASSSPASSSSDKMEIKKKYNDDNVDIMKLPPNIRVIPVTKFEKVALTKIAANPKQYPHITIVGKDERGWTIVRRRNIESKELEKLRKAENERQQQKAREQELPPVSTRKSMIERAREKLVKEEERILKVRKEAEEAGVRARLEKEAKRKEMEMEEKEKREKRMVALRATRKG
ncbi:hypothetical protein DM02DRAFT_631823 [Periconia macrospinosa]|uniref:Uncharacterized protein n=1 Tax=Periconia macrospinosa TaxID=97972 RepID=A0A2V1DHE0_9PLEO|nr:hypothetical protein DM02DRAFT_631823 [Periconia macrospinosa]